MNPLTPQLTKLCLGFIAVLSLAAVVPDYRIKPVEVLPIEYYPARQTIEQVTVALDPYSTDAKSYTAFDFKDLNSRGYFPINVLIKNGSTSSLSFRTRNVVLELAEGQVLYSTPAALVVEDIDRRQFSNKVTPSSPDKDPNSTMRIGSPLVDFTDKELTSRRIPPGEVVNGFLFFYSPNQKKNIFIGSSLKFPKILDEDKRTEIGPFVIRLDLALTEEQKGKR